VANPFFDDVTVDGPGSECLVPLLIKAVEQRQQRGRRRAVSSSEEAKKPTAISGRG
jgi:hypothetical protein